MNIDFLVIEQTDNTLTLFCHPDIVIDRNVCLSQIKQYNTIINEIFENFTNIKTVIIYQYLEDILTLITAERSTQPFELQYSYPDQSIIIQLNNLKKNKEFRILTRYLQTYNEDLCYYDEIASEKYETLLDWQKMCVDMPRYNNPAKIEPLIETAVNSRSQQDIQKQMNTDYTYLIIDTIQENTLPPQLQIIKSM